RGRGRIAGAVGGGPLDLAARVQRKARRRIVGDDRLHIGKIDRDRLADGGVLQPDFAGRLDDLARGREQERRLRIADADVLYRLRRVVLPVVRVWPEVSRGPRHHQVAERQELGRVARELRDAPAIVGGACQDRLAQFPEGAIAARAAEISGLENDGRGVDADLGRDVIPDRDLLTDRADAGIEGHELVESEGLEQRDDDVRDVVLAFAVAQEHFQYGEAGIDPLLHGDLVHYVQPAAI